jgi:hypothetical protein
MLFSPEAHEVLVEQPWSAERMRKAIASIVADAENAFDDGWRMHPQDVEAGDDASTRFRTDYLGGAGVVHALHRLEQRGFVELRRDYVSYGARREPAGVTAACALADESRAALGADRGQRGKTSDAS